jgi:hypothetical protein
MRISDSTRKSYINLLIRINNTSAQFADAPFGRLANMPRYDKELDALVGSRQDALRLLAFLYPAKKKMY